MPTPIDPVTADKVEKEIDQAIEAKNRTSQAVVKFAASRLTMQMLNQREEVCFSGPAEARAIADKYERIELALRNGQQRYCAHQCLQYPGHGHTPMCIDMTDALSFDPLTQ